MKKLLVVMTVLFAVVMFASSVAAGEKVGEICKVSTDWIKKMETSVPDMNWRKAYPGELPQDLLIHLVLKKGGLIFFRKNQNPEEEIMENLVVFQTAGKLIKPNGVKDLYKALDKLNNDMRIWVENNILYLKIPFGNAVNLQAHMQSGPTHMTVVCITAAKHNEKKRQNELKQIVSAFRK